jgi:uncharacterized membrane protein YqjE
MADITKSTAAAPARATESNQTEIENLPTLFGRLGDEVMQLVDTKLNLLKVEVKQEASTYARGATMIAIGGAIAAIGFTLLNIAVAFFVSLLFSFSQPVNYALGFVITGALYLIIGGILVMVTKNRLAHQDLVPERSVEELRKDKQWLKKEI